MKKAEFGSIVSNQKGCTNIMANERTVLSPVVQADGLWRVQITWANGSKHHVGKFATSQEAGGWCRPIWHVSQFYSLLNGWMFGMARMPFSPSTIASNLLPGIRRFLGERDIYPGAWTLEIEVLFYLFCAACGAWWRGSIIILAGAGLLIASAASSYLTNRWSLYPQSGFIAFMLCGTAISKHFRGRMHSGGACGVLCDVRLA
jgi:peptidoglycan/LPS O-acetylase OafA/YrhL